MRMKCLVMATALLVGTAACDWSSSAPKVPLALSVSARQIDGAPLRVLNRRASNSNFSHVDWPSSFRGDTLTATIILPVADAPHAIVMW